MKRRIILITVIAIIIGIAIYILIDNGIIFNKKDKPQSINLNYSSIGLKVNNTLQLSTYILPDTLDNQDIIYESSNESIVVVNRVTGLIEAKKEGIATITVKSAKYSSVKDTCQIFVANKDLKVDSIVFNSENINLNVGESYQIKYNLIPNDATVHEIEFISSDDEIANVDPRGIIIAKKTGSTKIKILDKITNKYKEFTVTVVGDVKNNEKETIKEIELSFNNKTMIINEKSQISAIINPKTNKEISWLSSDSTVASIDNNGNITALKKGIVCITAKIEDLTKSAFVEVIENENNNSSFFIAIFDGKSTLSCTKENNACKIIAPEINNKEGYEILGWSENKNAHQEEIKVGEEIILNENKEFFPIVRKKVNINYIVEENSNLLKEGDNSCYIYNNEDKCDVKTPLIIGKDRYVSLGWNINNNHKTTPIKNGETVSIDSDTSLYSVVAKRNYLTVIFKIQDANAVKESSKIVTCQRDNNDTCTITVPNFTENDGYSFLGFDSSKNATEGSIKSGNSITISSDMIFYSITKEKKAIVADFIIQNSTATKSSEITSCELFNGNKTCTIIVPTLSPTKNNEVIGWNQNKDEVISTLKSGEEITLKKNITYYSITKNLIPLTATFEIVTPDIITSNKKTAFCNPYNGNKECMIVLPDLTVTKSNAKAVGWSITKNDTKKILENGNKVLISKNTTYYSLVSEVITVTFNVGENIDKKNIRAEKLAYNYTDKDGKTITKEEGNTLSTTCTSYNGEGCTINNVPAIYSKGNFIYGFARNADSKPIAVEKTKFKENITLYARCGYIDNKKGGITSIARIPIAFQKTYGNVVLEIQTHATDVINEYESLLDTIYKVYPELFYYNGKLTILDRATYNRIVALIDSTGLGSAGITFFYNGFDNVYIHTSSNNPKFALIHELGHTFDYFRLISKSDAVTNLFNKYKNMEVRPLEAYAYKSKGEFLADIVAEAVRLGVYEKTGTYLYDSQGSLPDDLKSMILKTMNSKRDYLIENKRILTSD